MPRFRKKSDAGRSTNSTYSDLSSPSAEYLTDRLPELPPLSDFRTSLILPDLSRRFTLLRASAGDSAVDAIKSRLAYQREVGAENQITEADEDMFLDTLALRSKIWSSTGDKSEESIPESSRRSTASSNPTTPGTPTSRKRHSNNLFGSGKFRDYTYIRSQTRSKQRNSNKTDDIAEEDPVVENAIRSAPLIPPAPYGEQTLSDAEHRITKSLGSAAFRRASMALEEAIRELEEEAEDQIVMPRSAPISRLSFDQQRSEPEPSSAFEPGTAISSDKQVRTELEERRVSPIPTRTLPGYIPGMPRPMTPRELVEADEQRSHSTTPRATSPMVEASIVSLASSLIRKDSTASTSSSRFGPRSMSPSSPLFIQRSPNNGRHTPEDGSHRTGDLALDFEFPSSSQNGARRRPASPLSGPAYQPLAVSPVPSRSGTPSNVSWVAPPVSQKPTYEHNRNGSWFSSDGSSESAPDPAKSPPRSSMKSPPLPDSPVIDRSHATIASFGSSSFDSQLLSLSDLSFPNIPATKPVRSPTPTQQRSPASPTFPSDLSPVSGSRRSSPQNHHLSNTSTFLPIMLSPHASSSRSSLDSVGSSYHSWDGEKDRSYSLFTDTEITQPSWHEISLSEQSLSPTPGGSPEDDWDPEDIINKYAGLKKADFKAIQGKLVSVATNKVAPDRNSSLRRRRPSTSQSNYSFSGSKLGPPQSPTQQSTPSATGTQQTAEQYSPSAVQAHNALLNAVVDSIQSATPKPTNLVPPVAESKPQRDVSPNSRRNRDLAHILFGDDNEEERPSASLTSPPPQTPPLQSPMAKMTSPVTSLQNEKPQRNLLSPKSPQEQAELAREVQRKTEAAMAALRKPPSTTNLSTEGLVPSGSVRRRISPNQISTPTLVSASTSVDTIPLRAPSISAGHQPASKLGSRFRKLTGTLRKSNVPPTGEEITPYPLDMRSAPPVQTIRYDPESLSVPGAMPPASATEPGRYKVPLPSPPASAGPGLKGFMARFRGNKQRSDPYSDNDHHTSPLSPSSSPHLPLPDYLSQPQRVRQPHLPTSPTSPLSPYPSSPPSSRGGPLSSPPDESRALQQLFDAASNLGLDQDKLNDLLLVRSGSTSSRFTDALSTITVTSPSENRASRVPSTRRSSIDSPTSRGNTGARKSVASTRKAAESGRRPREGQAIQSQVIRRTILVPDDIQIEALQRKNSSRRRRMSGASLSNKSVHDRVPTPPPRSPTSRRFSAEDSPPVPQLPRSFASRAESMLNPPPIVPIEKSNSTYDSLYDMYTEEVKQPQPSSTTTVPANHVPALEVIELANGQVIWNIVNNLRDEDYESVYPGRASFASDYEADEGVKVSFRQHGRHYSQGSASSFGSRKPNDEDDSVKYVTTSSAQIGRIIEDLSKGIDAGSFNFTGAHGLGHSTTSSMSENDMNWSVEERLDHMLGVIRNS